MPQAGCRLGHRAEMQRSTNCGHSKELLMSVSWSRPFCAGDGPVRAAGKGWALIRSRSGLLLLVFLALLILAAGLGLRDPWPADEPRFALIARTMLDTGQGPPARTGGALVGDQPPNVPVGAGGSLPRGGSWRLAFLLPSLLA